MSNKIDFEFGRSIGATHYRDGIFYKRINGEWYAYFDLFWDRSENPPSSNNSKCKPIPAAETWTIHNNTLPLGELSDEQYGKLRRAADAGGVVELLLVGGEWCNAEPNWCDDLVYRIKPKSEREVFVERCMAAAGQESLTTGMGFKDAYGRLFDAGCRFVEVK